MKLCKKQLHKKNTGFTMTEILIVVGIILALLAVSVPGIIRLRKTLRQRELDSKAEVLYMAAQARMTQLRTGGFGELYGKMPEDAVTKTSDLEPGTVVNGVQYVRKDIVPADAVNDQGQAENLCYVVSQEGEAAYRILPQESVDKDLWSGSWIVEFDPETGVVYAVFYSEDSLLEDTTAEAATADLDSQRVKSQRLAKGARVGYYGGDLTLTSWNVSDNVKPEIVIVNEEKLTAKLYCSAPKKPLLRVTVTDTAGNSCVMDIPQNQIHQTRVGVYQADLVLDSLESKDTSFYALTKGKLLCGTNITVTLTAGLSEEDLNSGEPKLSAEARTNSLFAYREDGESSTAYIAYGRHLQNLDDSTSHVLHECGGISSGITGAAQLGNISFLDDSPYAAAYGSRLFTPIHNDRLTAYRGNLVTMDGKVEGTPTIMGLRIEATENNVGLFSTFAGTIQDILVTGPKILGGAVVSGREVGTANVGTLIGSVSGLRKTEIRNVQVFLSDAQGDLNMAKVNSVSQVTPWLRGRNVGGLIGSASSNELVIVGSSASMPIKAERYAGGLVGTVNCKTTVQYSYADGYLRGTYVGGLIGGAGSRSTIILSDFYAVGYGLAEEKAAGWVVFDEGYTGTLYSAYNGYSAMDLAIEQGKTGTVYPTAPSCRSASGVSYAWQDNWEQLGGTLLYDCRNTDVERLSYEILSGNQAFSYKDGDGNTKIRLKGPFEHVTDTISVTKAYNLMDQGLTGYPLPKLRVTGNGSPKLLTHYGDWKASFEEGALVYYEIDENGNYRFEGGNVSVDQIGANSGQLDYTQRPKIVGDGYALAYYTTATVTDWSATVSMDGKSQTLKDKDKITVSGYRLYPIDKSLLNDDAASAKSFYRKLTVTEKDGDAREYYLNPNFASCFGGSTQAIPEVVRIRSPRQLYALSRLYGSYAGLNVFTQDTVFRQELDLDYSVYQWAEYYQTGSAVVSGQMPIGTEDTPFAAVYDGQSNTVQGLGIRTKENQVGLFGLVEARGRVSNLVLIGRSLSPIAREWGDQTAVSVVSGVQTVNIGALVGYNRGTVQNCAVTGYEFSASVYNGATLNLGGLVGKNEGTIYNSSAETPHFYLRDTSANVYAGGLVGDNSGSVSASYAAGYLEMAEAQKLDSGKNTARIAGFAARNDNGNLVRCYAGAPLMGSGDTQMYGFACAGGSVLHCYYLDGGTYEYRDSIYSLNASGNAYSGSAKGIPVTAAELRDSITLSGFVKGNVNTYLGNGDRSYSYPASLTRNGSPMHFGPWPNQDKDMGEFGVFYWEYEKDGNTGYHLSFQGTSGGKATVKGETLCEAHDDGGVITRYGYGYFYKPSANLLPGQEDPLKPKLTTANCVTGDEYTAASAALEEQMPQYKFVAFKTGLDGLRMTGSSRNLDREANRNAFWTLTDQVSGSAYTYCVSPFFGDAFNLVTSEEGPVDGKLYNDAGELCNDTGDAGTEARPYQVRSMDQLQFINWNFENSNTNLYLNAGNKDSGLHKKYPYLSYGKYEEGDGSPGARLDLYWVQTHDLNAENWGKAYTPIGSMYDDAADSAKAHATMAFFSGSYDGKAYVIKNVSIETSAQCVGIFGVTAGAKMKNIILYSDKSSKIIHNDSKSWYSMGGIAGMAGRMGQVAEFTNCTVSGYTIIDLQKTKPGWGGGCIGGLVGTSTMNLTNCTAASTIQLEIGYKDLYQNLRVGGLVGCARSEISGCYAGGTVTSKNPGGSSNIWIGGILGGIVLRNEGNLEKLIGSYDGPTKLSNCYSFVEMPAVGNNIKASYAIGSNGEMLETCYPVGYDYIVIENCYAYANTSTNADDYAVLKNGKSSYWQVNLNRKHQVSMDNNWDFFDTSNAEKKWARVYWRDRRVELRNQRNPFLSYKEMKEQLLGYLNAGITGGKKFDTVTVSESGVSINGKYCFPGDDAQLVGLDYPFPTILTQEAFGETVNVHYGPWPKFGLYWEEHKVNIDLVENRNKTGTDLLALYGSEEPEEDAVDPAQTVPETTVPETTEPEPTVPETTVPETTVPETTVPEATVPETTVPETTVPETAASEAAVSEMTLPEGETAEIAREAAGEGEEPESPVQEPAQAEKTQTEGTVQDVVTLDADSLQAIMTYKLYLIQVGNRNISEPVLELQDADGNPISADQAAARILSYDTDIQWDGSDYLGYFNVVFQAKHPGVVRVKASLTKDPNSTNPLYPPTVYEDYMTITVTADLKIVIQEESLPLTAYEGDSFQEAELVLEDSTGERLDVGENAGYTWVLSIDSQESETDLVTWNKNAFIRTETVKDAATGKDVRRFFLTTLKGYSPGEGSLKLALTYTWDTTAADPKDTIESSLVIPVVVHPSDVLGIGDGTASRELSLPHTPPSEGTFTDELRTDETNVPRAEGLFLYASNDSFSYTDLASFQVKKAELKLNGTYRTMTPVEPVAAGGDPTDPSQPPEEDTGSTDFTYQAEDGRTVTVRVSDTLAEPEGRNTRYTYRPITVEGAGEDQWSLRLTLWPKDAVEGQKHRSYVLEYNRPNTVRFCWRNENGEETLLKDFRVEQGEDLSKLDQDELDELLADLAEKDQTLPQGHHWTWPIPQGVITANQTVVQTSAAIRYYVAYNAGYEDYEWDDNVPIENSTFVYGQEGKVLPACTYNRPGYRFVGWDTDDSADTVVFRDGEGFTDEAIFAGQEYLHNLTLTLYAVWEPKDYTVSYNGGFSGWDAEGMPRMEPSVYSIARPDGALAENKFLRDGYTFQGWAYESGAQKVALAADATLEDAMRRGGEYVVYQDVTLYAVWKQDTAQGTDDPGEEADSTQEEDVPQEDAAPGEDLPETPPSGEEAESEEKADAPLEPEETDVPQEPEETDE